MKILLLISLAIGLAQCDKLDRTYLPPASSGTAGGYHGDLNLPLEFQKENNPLTLDPGSNNIIIDGSLTSNYPNLEFGINTQVPSVSASSESFANEPGISVSKTIYNVPSTTTSYAFTQTTTVLPVETYDKVVPVTTFPQGYSSTSSPFDPNLSYDQYLIQQIIDPNTAQQIFSYTDLDVPGTNLSNDNISQSSINSQFGNSNPQTENFQQLPQNIPVGFNVEEYVSGQSDEIGGPEPIRTNVDYSTSSNIIPQSLPTIIFPTNQYGDNSDSISLVSIPTIKYSYPDKYNQLNLKTYPSLQQYTNKFDAAGIISLDSIKSGFSSTVSTDEIRAGTSKSAVAITTTSSIPTHLTPADSLNINFNKNPQRVQTEADRNAVIINNENILTPEGFAYSFDTSNGIHADESGTAINGVKAKGSYSFIGDDGKVYTIEYTADENGFLPRGDHLPTAPPIPDVILRGIEQAEKQKQLGIDDDGSYDDAKYGHERYQGFMRRIPQHRINDDIIRKPGTRENILTSKLISPEGIDIASNHRKNSDDILFANEDGKMLNHANQIKMVEAYKEVLPKFTDSSKPIDNTNFKSDELEDLNDHRVIIVPKNKLRDNSINGNPKTILEYNKETNNENNYTIFTNLGVSSPMRQILHKGYEYTQPQKIFNENDGNRLQSRFSNAKEGDTSKPDEETTGNTTPKIKNQKPNSNTQILRTNFNDPFTTHGSISSFEDLNGNFGQPQTSTLYSKKTNKMKGGEIPVKDTNRVFMTIKPAYTSTTLGSSYYQSPDTSTVDGNRRINYPSSSQGTKLFVSTTPLPSEISSHFTSSMNNLNYPRTTPTTISSTSTLRPLITSGRSGNTSQGLGLRGTGSGEIVDSKLTNRQQNRLGPKVTGRPGYQGTTETSPAPQKNFYGDFKPRFGVSTDPPSQSIASAPGDSDSLSPTKKIIGEDFSGPKQLQKFDPHYGYYY